MLLSVENLRKTFGGLVAVNDVTFQVPERSIISVIGPNGAGKTTFFNMITGIYQPDRGTISLAGKDLVGLKPDEVTVAGIARTFQNIRLFSSMTAVENIMVARNVRMKLTAERQCSACGVLPKAPITRRSAPISWHASIRSCARSGPLAESRVRRAGAP